MEFNTNLFAQAAPALLLLSFGEFLLASHERRKAETRKNIFNSIVIGLVFIALTLPLKTIPYLIFSWVYQFRLIEFRQVSGIAIFMCFLCNDFTVYWIHRMHHSVRLFWASHQVHHSSETYSFISASRESWVGIYTGVFMLWSWMPLIGFSPEMMIWVKSVSTFYQFLVHTEHIRKLPRWIEFIFNTPSHHRVHHSSEIEDLDMNNGAILIIWDRLFGTFKEEEPEKEHKYGLTKKIENPNPVSINFSEFGSIIRDLKKSPQLSDKLMYIFGPPGWSHDGSTKTAKQLRNEWAMKSTPMIEMRNSVADPASFNRKKAVQLVGSR